MSGLAEPTQLLNSPKSFHIEVSPLSPILVILIQNHNNLLLTVLPLVHF